METELHKKGFFMPIGIFLSYLLILGFMIVGTFEITAVVCLHSCVIPRFQLTS